MNWTALLIALPVGVGIGVLQLAMLKKIVGPDLSAGKRAVWIAGKIALWAACLIGAALIEPGAAIGIALGGCILYHIGAARVIRKANTEK